MVDYNSEYDRDRLDIVDKSLAKIEDPRTLAVELGSNNGTTTSLLARKFGQTVAIDCIPEAIDQARQNVPAPNVEWVLHDLNRPLPVAMRGKFDVAVALEVVEHLDSPRNFLREVRGCLKPGGRLLLSTPNLASLEGMMGRYRAWKAGTVYNAWDPTHKSLFNSSRILRLVRDSGFDIQSVTGYYYSAAPFPIFNRFRVPLKKSFRWPLNRLGFNILIEARAAER